MRNADPKPLTTYLLDSIYNNNPLGAPNYVQAELTASAPITFESTWQMTQSGWKAKVLIDANIDGEIIVTFPNVDLIQDQCGADIGYSGGASYIITAFDEFCARYVYRIIKHKIQVNRVRITTMANAAGDIELLTNGSAQAVIGTNTSSPDTKSQADVNAWSAGLINGWRSDKLPDLANPGITLIYDI